MMLLHTLLAVVVVVVVLVLLVSLVLRLQLLLALKTPKTNIIRGAYMEQLIFLENW
jgi:hypothetical protein